MRFVEQLDMRAGGPLGCKEARVGINSTIGSGSTATARPCCQENTRAAGAGRRLAARGAGRIYQEADRAFRAFRQYAGVLFYTYLALTIHANTCDRPTTCNRACWNRISPTTCERTSAGVYIHLAAHLTAGQAGHKVMLVNDACEPAQRLELLWESDQGEVLQRTEIPYGIDAVGQKTYELELAAPQLPGKHVLMARAFWGGKPFSPTVSRRKVSVDPAPSK